MADHSFTCWHGSCIKATNLASASTLFDTLAAGGHAVGIIHGDMGYGDTAHTLNTLPVLYSDFAANWNDIVGNANAKAAMDAVDFHNMWDDHEQKNDSDVTYHSWAKAQAAWRNYFGPNGTYPLSSTPAISTPDTDAVFLNNSDTAGVNGAYVDGGVLNTKAFYDHEDIGQRISWTGTLWQIEQTGFPYAVFYTSTEDVATPDLVTSWTEVNATGAPAIDFAQTGAIYHAWTTNRVRFIATDNRSERVDGADMWGSAQDAWFKDEIDKATANPNIRLIIWISSQPYHSVDTTSDNWGDTGHDAHRLRLKQEVFGSDNSKRIIVIGGDMHNCAIDDGTNTVGNLIVHQAAPLGNTRSVKGGAVTYTKAVMPDTGLQHWAGIIDIVDIDGQDLVVTMKGIDENGATLDNGV